MKAVISSGVMSATLPGLEKSGHGIESKVRSKDKGEEEEESFAVSSAHRSS